MYYNQIEINNPFISWFFPDLSESKLFKLTIISELEEFDIPLIGQAQKVMDMIEECLSEDNDIELDIEHWFNHRYFPNIEKPSDEDEEEHTKLVGDTLYFRDGDENQYQMDDYIVTETTASIGETELCSVTTLLLATPPSLENKPRLH